MVAASATCLHHDDATAAATMFACEAFWTTLYAAAGLHLTGVRGANFCSMRASCRRPTRHTMLPVRYFTDCVARSPAAHRAGAIERVGARRCCLPGRSHVVRGELIHLAPELAPFTIHCLDLPADCPVLGPHHA